MILAAKKRRSSNTSAFSQTRGLAGIEILRFLCALAILIWHYQNFFFVGEPENSQMAAVRSAQPFYGTLQYAYEGGFWAVQVFWGISGFIFYWTYAQPIFERRVGLIEFAVRRFSRLYPLHITTLIIVVFLEYLYFRSHGQDYLYPSRSLYVFSQHLLFASNWFKGQILSFNGPVWSVSVEILVYFAFFAVIRKAGPGPATAVAACGVSWALDRINTIHIMPLSGSVFSCAVLFFAGGFALLLSRQRLGFLFCLGAGAVTGALLASSRIHMNSTIIAILTVCFVVVFARLGEMKFGSALTRLAFLGNATYSSYLMHFPIQLGVVIFVDAMGYRRDIFFAPIMLGTYLVSVIGISLAVYHFFELPAQKWIRDVAVRWRTAKS